MNFLVWNFNFLLISCLDVICMAVVVQARIWIVQGSKTLVGRVFCTFDSWVRNSGCSFVCRLGFRKGEIILREDFHLPAFCLSTIFDLILLFSLAWASNETFRSIKSQIISESLPLSNKRRTVLPATTHVRSLTASLKTLSVWLMQSVPYVSRIKLIRQLHN